jgi:mono/diheme cytochrome c family protein
VIAQGRTIFEAQCARCHNPGTSAPDLRRLPAGNYDALASVLTKGALNGRGMPGFQMSEPDVAAVRMYLLDERRKLASGK